MSRRTFPRAAAAGLIAAALGPTAAAQAPNPWRGESAAVPTAPAPRAVAPKPTRQLVVGVGFSSVGGLTGSIVFRDAAALAVAPAPREVTAIPSGLKPLSAAPVPAAWTPLPTSRLLERYPQYLPPAPAFPQAATAESDPEGIERGVKIVVPARRMPPPVPLPVERRQ